MPGSIRTSVLVIGGGPAGLSAAAACRARGHDFLLVEGGGPVSERFHDDQLRLGVGVGGSGLYSDGKFSFFPSASALWRLGDQPALQQSWRWFSTIVARYKVEAQALPEQTVDVAVNGAGVGAFVKKEYRSVYMPFQDRRNLIGELEGACGLSLLTGTVVRSLRFDPKKQLFHCVALGQNDGEIVARAVILAGGRFAPLEWEATERVFRRVEVGVRLEQPSEEFFLRGDDFLDPKLILESPDGRYGWRTFCCCREGEVVATEVCGLVTVSGRADCKPTGNSNVGFNLRVTDPALALSLWPGGLASIAKGSPVSQPLDAFLGVGGLSGRIAEKFGTEASRLLAEGLTELSRLYPSLRAIPCRVTAPAIEGVGAYPELDDNLRSRPDPLWIAGDGTGVFRGLTAAMVSGHFVALQAMGYTESSP